MIDIKWEITQKCNLTCKHCCNYKKYKLQNELKFKEIVNLIDQISQYGKFIQILGGEPFTKDNFIKILKYIDSKGLKIGINTNGTLITEKVALELVKLKNLVTVSFSLEGIGKKHDFIRGKGTFKKVITNIERLKKIRDQSNVDFKIMTVFTVTKPIFIKLDEILYLDDCGLFDQISFDFVRIEGNAVENIECLELTHNEQFDFVKFIGRKNFKVPVDFNLPIRIIKDINKRYHLSISIQESFCYGGTRHIFVDPFGNITPCNKVDKLQKYVPYIEKGIFNIRNHRLIDIYNSNEYLNFFRKIFGEENDHSKKICENCEFYEICKPCPLASPIEGSKKLCEYWIEEDLMKCKDKGV